MEAPERIEVDELVVRTYERGDAGEVVRAVTDSIEHLRPWMPWIRFEPQSVADREVWIAGLADTRASGGGTVYGIFSGSRLVGGTGFQQRGDPGTVEIGYWVSIDAVRRRIASRVAGALTVAAFVSPDIERVEICHDRRNVASGRVPAGLGFHLVEEYRRRPVVSGESGLIHRWRIERDEAPRTAA